MGFRRAPSFSRQVPLHLIPVTLTCVWASRCVPVRPRESGSICPQECPHIGRRPRPPQEAQARTIDGNAVGANSPTISSVAASRDASEYRESTLMRVCIAWPLSFVAVHNPFHPTQPSPALAARSNATTAPQTTGYRQGGSPRKSDR